MLFAIPYDQLAPRRLPWVTWAVGASWLVVYGLNALGWPAALWDAATLVPGQLATRGLALHWLLHESWAHLMTGIVVLMLVGPALEEAWGHTFFAAACTLALLFGAGSYSLMAGDSARPLVGASAALAALIAAFVYRFRQSGVGYTAVGWWQGLVHTQLRVPSWTILGVWVACEVAMQLAGSGVGATRGINYGGQLAGAALGLLGVIAVQRFDLERRWLGRLPEGAPHPALEEAALAREEHGPMAAVSLLLPAMRERPDDASLVLALCDHACAGGEPGRATRPFLELLRARLADDESEAAALWVRWARPLRRPDLDLRTRIRLAEAVRRHGDATETARLLQPVIQAGPAFTPGLALRVVELARDVHAGIALAAIARALEGPDLHETKRAKLAATRDVLEQRRRLEPDPELDDAEEVVVQDRSIEIEPDEDLRRPPPGVPNAPDPADTGPVGLSLDGLLETTSGEYADLSGGDLADTQPILDPVGVSQHAQAAVDLAVDLVEAGMSAAGQIPRLSDAKRIDAIPVAWEPGRVCLKQGAEAPAWLELSQVEAIAVAGIQKLAAKPVIVVDLLLNWTELQERPLRVVRWRSDRFDPGALRDDLGSGLSAFRKLIEGLLVESKAAPLPDLESVCGRPFRMYDGIDAYEREVLGLDV